MKIAFLGIPLFGLSAVAFAFAAQGYEPLAAPAVLKGKTDRSDPAVVMIRHGDSFCTAAVIAPRYLLTAAHCVNDVDIRSEPITVEHHPIRRVHLPDRSNRWVHDVAVLELSTPVSVAPLPVNLDASPVEGLTEIRLVGYGRTRTSKHDGQTKRTSTARVNVTRDFLEFGRSSGSGLCYGDSGGPALAEIDGRETIVGVASHVTQDDCEDGGAWVRTDRLREFLAPFVGAAPTPAPTPEPKVDPTPTPKIDPTPTPQINPPKIDPLPDPQPVPQTHRHHHRVPAPTPAPTPAPAPDPSTVHVDTVHIQNGDVTVIAGPDGVTVIQNGQRIMAGPNGVRIEQLP